MNHKMIQAIKIFFTNLLSLWNDMLLARKRECLIFHRWNNKLPDKPTGRFVCSDGNQDVYYYRQPCKDCQDTFPRYLKFPNTTGENTT